MLVCRVCMGNHYTIDEVSPTMKGIIEKLDTARWHSVLGDREKARGTSLAPVPRLMH